MSNTTDKLAQFQQITGLHDTDLCTEILSAHQWNLEQAISTITSSSSSSDFEHINPTNSFEHSEFIPDNTAGPPDPPGLGLAWKLISLPVSIVSGSLGLVSGAVGLGLWAVGGVVSYSLGMIGLNNSGEASDTLVAVSGSVSEAREFVRRFESEYGDRGPRFVAEGFMDALERSRREFKLLFVYLHSPDHPDTEWFCGGSLCDEVVSSFVNENFVAWGGSVKASEGFKMSNSLKASRFPFCAVVMAASNQRIALLQQVEGPKSPEEMLTMLQRVVEESASVLLPARLDAEERRNNMRLREEQDAAYQAALEADEARERQRREEQEQVEREAAEAERKQHEEEEARERTAREAAEREAQLIKVREEKSLSLGPEPEKGPDVTQVLVRLPNGERKGRRFHSTTTIQSLYDFVDSSGTLEMGSYTLVTNFPRVLYGPDKLSLTLKEVGLHPQASLFVEMKS
ncbi:putative UBX domain, Ubiquitin-like domain superfamily, Thioredoxin-like superfamily [Helianthus annuus]|nr:putative UBX domain, Ubiquitin-like domain superfamily, Thioredoxin-like superfamily [Helianthus annuus]